MYTQYKICWKGWIGIFSLMLAAAIGVLASAEAEPILFAAPLLLLFLIQITFCFKLAKAFGKGFFMGLLLVLTAGFGRIILGFGGSRYVGKMA